MENASVARNCQVRSSQLYLGRVAPCLLLSFEEEKENEDGVGDEVVWGMKYLGI